MLEQILYRWNRIYSPVHALAFTLDPLFYEFRRNVSSVFGPKFIEMGKAGLPVQCMDALKLFAHDDAGFCKLSEEFLRVHAMPPEEVFKVNPTQFLPILVWSMVQESYPKLYEVIKHVFRAPGSSAGVERNHKVSKRVHRRERNRLGSGKVWKFICFMLTISDLLSPNTLATGRASSFHSPQQEYPEAKNEHEALRI